MKTLVSLIIFSLLIASNVFAAPDRGYMRDLTIETMLNYAKELYQRGDISEAKNVMARIKQLGAVPDEKPKAERPAVVVTKAKAPCCSYLSAMEKKPIVQQELPPDPNADLRQAIAKEDQIIASLNNDVSSLRQQIQATQHE